MWTMWTVYSNRKNATPKKPFFAADPFALTSGQLNVATEWGATLIVMTSHERKGVAKFLHRSVA